MASFWHQHIVFNTAQALHLNSFSLALLLLDDSKPSCPIIVIFILRAWTINQATDLVLLFLETFRTEGSFLDTETHSLMPWLLTACLTAVTQKQDDHVGAASGQMLSHLKPLCAKLLRGNLDMYLYFMPLLQIDMVQVVEILPQVRQGLTYST